MTKQEQDLKKQREFFEKMQKEDKKRQLEHVEGQELSARSWKAHYDKMYYTIESRKLQDEYKIVQAQITEELEAQKKANEEANSQEQETELEQLDAVGYQGGV